MNMKKYLMLCGVMLAATFIGCTDEGFENGGVPENPVQKGDEILFGASVSGDADQLNLNGKDSKPCMETALLPVFLYIGKKKVIRLPFSVPRLPLRPINSSLIW